MFLFETIALVLSVLAVACVHVVSHFGPRCCPRCHLPAESVTDRAVVHADAPELFETWETHGPALALVTPAGLVPMRLPDERPVQRRLQRRETLTNHLCRLCRHTWQTGGVELVRGGELPTTSGNVRVFPGRAR